MAMLAGLITISVRPILTRGKQSSAQTEIATICTALDSFYTTYGRYPSNEEGLAVPSRTSGKLVEPLLKQLPMDPWGHPYEYNQPGRNNEPYEVICFGADGREGGEGADGDIISWNLKESAAKESNHALAR